MQPKKVFRGDIWLHPEMTYRISATRERRKNISVRGNNFSQSSSNLDRRNLLCWEKLSRTQKSFFFFFFPSALDLMIFPYGSEGKEFATSAGDLGSIPGSGRSPGEGNSNPLQHSCLDNPINRGAWRATSHRVAKSQTQLSNWHFHFLLWIKTANNLKYNLLIPF